MRFNTHRFFTLALCTLFTSLALLPARAGQWIFTGTVNNNGTTSQVNSVGSWSAYAHTSHPAGSVSSTLTFTLTGTWTPSSPGDTSQPPPSMLVTPAASCVNLVAQPPLNQSISDGMGDSQITMPYGLYGLKYTSTGKHIVSQQNGTFSITVTQTVTSNQIAIIDCSLSVTPDNRSVSVNSQFGQTFHSSSPGGGLGTKVPDVLQGSTINANTVLPGINEIDYNAVLSSSNWGQSSLYQWSVALGSLGVGPNQSTWGNFTLPGDYPLDIDPNYIGVTNPEANPPPGNGNVYVGNTEKISIALTDSSDGAKASGYYNLLFHAPVENWQRSTASNAIVPLPPTVIGTSASTSAGQPATISSPAQDQENYSGLLQTMGGVFTCAPAAMTAFCDPPAVVATLLTAVGYKLSLSTPPTPTAITMPAGNQAQWDQDVQTELAIISGTYTGFMPNVARMTKQLAQQASASGDGPYWGSGTAGYQLMYIVTDYQAHNQVTYLGDGYDAHGYTGQVTGTVSIPIAINNPFVYVWTATGGPPPTQ